MILHEASELHDPAKDAVATTVMRIEHHPGQLEHIIAFLSEIAHKAGVYFAELEHKVFESEAPLVAQSIGVPTEIVEGEAHGEPTVLAEHLEPETAGGGEGNEAPPEGETHVELSDQGEHGELAWPAGAGAEGKVTGDA